MKLTLSETDRRRKIQQEYNEKHGIVPTTVIRKVIEDLGETFFGMAAEVDPGSKHIEGKDIAAKIADAEKEMKLAAKELRFEDAARYRDTLRYYKSLELLDDRSLFT